MRRHSLLSLAMLAACANPGGPSGEPVIAREALGAGQRVSCGITAQDVAHCWGYNFLAHVGDGTRVDRPAPVPLAANVRFVQVSPGFAHGCALAADGRAFCWGQDFDGATGHAPAGSSELHLAPTPVPTALRFVQVSASGNHTCALTRDGTAYCWGANAYGQLGDGTQTSRAAPAPVASAEAFQAISAGMLHTCALRRDGAAYCWGASGRPTSYLVTPQNELWLRPVAMAPALRFARITARSYHTLALTATGQAYAWGDNASGQLGDGTREYRPFPVPVSGALRFARVTAGGWHSCGIALGGAAHCWGAGGGGALGVGTVVEERLLPAPVSGGLTFVEIVAGLYHTTATTADGTAYAWGSNGGGELGVGESPTDVLAPAPVLGGLRFR